MQNNLSNTENREVVNLTLEQIEVRMDMLIEQTKIHFLEMGKLLKEYLSIKMNKHGLTSKESKRCAMERFKITNNTIESLVKTYETFGKIPQQHLPFNDYTKLGMIRGLSDVEIDELVNSTFEVNGEEKQGKDLSRKELQQVLREKRELEEALEKEKTRTESEKRKLEEANKKELEQLRRNIEFTKNTEIENYKKATSKRAMEIAKEKLNTLEIEEKIKAKLELDRIKEKEAKLEKERKELNARIENVRHREDEIRKSESIAKKYKEELYKLERAKEEASLELKQIKEKKNKVSEIKEFLDIVEKASNQLNSMLNRDFIEYINDEDIKPYIEVAIITLENTKASLDVALNNQDSNIINVKYKEV